MRGLVPRWGWRGAWQNPPCQFAVPSHNSRFSYLGGPAPAGTDDWPGTMSRSLNREGRLPLHPQEFLVGAIRGACFRYWIVVDGRQVHHVKVAEDRS